MTYCDNCGLEIEFTRGKAFTGYVHSDTGDHACRGGCRVAALPDYFASKENRRTFDTYILEGGNHVHSH